MRTLERQKQLSSTLQFVLCFAALVLAVLVAVFSVRDYRSAVREKDGLLAELKSTRAYKEEVIADNTVLRNEARHLKAKVKDAKEDIKNIDKIPKRIQKIDELTGNISDLESQLAELNQEIEALRAQLPPGTVIEIE